MKTGDIFKIWGPTYLWSQSIRNRVPLINCFYNIFLEKIFFWAILTKWRPPSVIHGWNALDLTFLIVFFKRKKFTLQMSDFLWHVQADIFLLLRPFKICIKDNLYIPSSSNKKRSFCVNIAQRCTNCEWQKWKICHILGKSHQRGQNIFFASKLQNIFGINKGTFTDSMWVSRVGGVNVTGDNSISDEKGKQGYLETWIRDVLPYQIVCFF